MPFQTKLLNLAEIQIRAWHLPDAILEDLARFLSRVLPSDIEHNLFRDEQGMFAECTRRDHHVKGRDHEFAFRIYFGQDEESLIIARGSYRVVDDAA